MNPEGCRKKSELNTNLNRHFIADEDLLEFLSNFGKGKVVLEIGGDALLTRKLVEKAERVYVIEEDKEFGGKLGGVGAQVITGNALKVKWPQFQVLLSSSPSLINEPLLFRMTRHDFEFAVLVVLEDLHREMSGKGKIGLLTGEFFEVEGLMEVPKQAFRPKLEAKAVAVKLKRKKVNTLFSKVLLQYDKKLKNALREALCSFGLTRREARFLVEKLGLDETKEKRVINLSDQDFFVLSNELRKLGKEVHKS
ncbi:hypothetical protein DRN62_02240 [Nanoarchaeota archaeon]|nr:MAG: hypothetical protein DRN62_02240 [Nanoarchaeota archaeon]